MAMDFQAIKEKYSKEQTVLETQIAALKNEVKTYRELAGIADTATLAEIEAEAEAVKVSLEEKAKELQTLLDALAE